MLSLTAFRILITKFLRKIVFATFILSTGELSAWAVQFVPGQSYEVRIDSGDILSLIIERCYPHHRGHIYGKHGILAKISEINPEISNLNELQVAEHLQLFELGKRDCKAIKKVENPDVIHADSGIRRITTSPKVVSRIYHEMVAHYDDVLPFETSDQPSNVSNKVHNLTDTQPSVPAVEVSLSSHLDKLTSSSHFTPPSSYDDVEKFNPKAQFNTGHLNADSLDGTVSSKKVKSIPEPRAVKLSAADSDDSAFRKGTRSAKSAPYNDVLPFEKLDHLDFTNIDIYQPSSASNYWMPPSSSPHLVPASLSNSLGRPIISTSDELAHYYAVKFDQQLLALRSYIKRIAPHLKEPAMNALPELVELKRPGWLAADLNFGYSRIDSTDVATQGQAILLSGLNTGVTLNWTQDVSDILATTLFYNLQREAYDTQTIQSSVNTDAHYLSKFGAKIELKPFTKLQRLTLLGSLFFNQTLYSRAVSVSENVLDSVFVSNLSIGGSYLAIDHRLIQVSAYATGNLLFPTITAGYSIPVGKALTVGAHLAQPFRDYWQIVGDFWYTHQTQNSSIATQTRKDVNISVGLRLHFSAELRRVEP